MPVAPRPTSRTMSSRWLLLWCRLLGCASGCVCLEEATLLLRSVSWYHLFQETLLIKEASLDREVKQELKFNSNLTYI